MRVGQHGTRIHKGIIIYPCELADWREHGGKWTLEDRHLGTGLPWADEYSPHFRSLREVAETIDKMVETR